MEKGAALQKLGPYFSRMTKDPSPSNAKALTEKLSQVSPQALQALHKGLLGSLIEPLLNPRLPLESKRFVLDCVTQLLSHTHIVNASVFWTVYNISFNLIYDDHQCHTIEAHEELKLSAVKCVTTALKQATVDVITEMYTKINVPKFSKCVYICKKLVQTEKFSALRVAAINCIMTVAYVHDEADENDVVLRHQIGDVVMFILPGTLSLLRDVILEGDTTPHKVKVIALRTWSRMIALVMEDSYATDDELMSPELLVKPINNLDIDWNVRSKEELVKRLTDSKRSPSWYQTAAEMITKSLRSISVVQVHSHWSIRKELALGCKTLVAKCSRNMGPAASYLLDILIVLVNDEVEAVLSISQQGLTLFADKLRHQTGQHLLTVVEENFYNVITSLPRVLKGVDDAKQLATLSLLTGYMKLLGKEKLSGVFLSRAHLERFMSMLIQAFELDNVAVQLLDDCSIKEVDSVSNINTNVSWRMFKTCTYPEQLTKLVHMCKLLAEYADVNMLSSYLLDLFSNSLSERKEVTVILNELLGSGAHRELFHVVENVFDVYLDPSVWYAPLKTGVVDDNCVTIVQARSNVIQACLLLEGVGKMIKSIGSNSEPLLKDVLFPVLERAGSSHELVALFGLEALCSIAAAYGHPGDAAYIVNANLDYLSNTIHVKLRRSDEDISALNVLRVMTKHSTAEKLPQLKGVLEKAIKQSYGTYQTTDALLFLDVLHPLMVSLRHLKEDKPATPEDSVTESFSRNITSGEVVEELLSYHRNKIAASNFKDEDSEDEVTQPVAEEETRPKEKDPLTELTISVMQRCVHLVSTNNRQVTLLVLSVLNEGVVVLKDQEDHLLPVVHQIWAPLLTRLCDLSDHMVGRHSLQLLLVLAETAKSFIRQRTLQKVLPHFCQFLSANVENSKKKDQGHAYRFTQVYKLQLEMLQGLGNLAVNIGLQEREVWQVLEASCAYLSCWQPLPFQQACVQLCIKLATLNRETVWLKLMELWCESQVLQPTVETLPCIRLASESSQEYERNVKQILSVIT